MAAQRQYSKNKKTPRKNDGEVPEPFPPPTLKAEIYDVADYADIDAYARKVGVNCAHTSDSDVVHYMSGAWLRRMNCRHVK